MRLLFLSLVLSLAFNVQSQTEYVQYFDGPTLPSEWASSEPKFINTLETNNSLTELKMEVDKTGKYDAFTITFSGEIDISASPHLKMKFRAIEDYTQGFQLTFHNTSAQYASSDRLNVSKDGNNIYIDLSKISSDFDWSTLTSVGMRVNRTVDAWSSVFYFDYLIIGPQAMPSPDKDITAFTFPAISSTTVIDDASQTINVSVSGDFNIKAMTPEISHNGTGISPASGVVQDFSNVVKYTATAQDKTTKEYSV